METYHSNMARRWVLSLQRKGRIVRQGNMNPEVKIFRYVTEGTFDAYLWQTIENKQKFISQVMTSKSPVRSCDDIDEATLSYAEVKALCAGDPRIKEKMDLDVEVSRLKLLQSSHQNQRFQLEDNILRRFPSQIQALNTAISQLESDRKLAEANPAPTEGREELGQQILAAMKQIDSPEGVKFGSYRGFDATITLANFSETYSMTLRDELVYQFELGSDARGNVTRMDNALAAIPSKIEALRKELANVYEQLESAKVEVATPFPQEAELREKSARLVTLNAELNLDGKASVERPSVLEKLKNTPSISGGKSTKIHTEVR